MSGRWPDSTPSVGTEGLDMIAADVPEDALSVVVSAGPSEAHPAGTALKAGESVSVSEGDAELAPVGGVHTNIHDEHGSFRQCTQCLS